VFYPSRGYDDLIKVMLVLSEVFGASDGGALVALAAHQLVTGHALYRADSWLSQRETPDLWKGSQTSDSSVHGFVAGIGEDAGSREMFVEKWALAHRNIRAVLDDKKLSLHIYFDPGRHADRSLCFEKTVLALAEKAGKEAFLFAIVFSTGNEC